MAGDYTRQLGQLRPADTTAGVVYSPSEHKPYKINTIIITNVSAADTAKAWFYHDVDGTTYDETTAIVSGHSLEPGELICFEFEKGIGDYRAAGNMAAKSTVASALNFTVYGEVEGERL